MKWRKYLSLALVAGLSGVLWVAGCGEGENTGEDEVVKAAWVYIGPPGDHGWTYSHDQGRLEVEALLGEEVETRFEENVPEDAAGPTIEALAEDGYDIVFTTSYGYMDATEAAAEKYPDVRFEHCSGYKANDTNFGNYFGRVYQSRYLTGLVAGRMTSSNAIGYIAAFPIPEVIRGINAFTLGVRAVNPDAQVHVAWTSTWYDPSVEGQAAEGLLDAGCDVLAQHQDSTAAINAAAARGAYAVGYHSDMSSFATETVLTSAIWNWGAYYTKRVQAVKDGTWEPGSYWGGLGDGVVGLGAYGDMVQQTVRDEVAARRQVMIDGTWDVFDGPVNGQDGSTWVAEGEALDDGQLLEMMQFVEGVVGDIPSP